MSWTALVGELAEAMRETGDSAAALNAAAWSAGVMPEATKGLVGAALALGAPLRALFVHIDPLKDDRAMLTASQDIESAVAEMLRDARNLWQRIVADRENAYRCLAAARAAYAAAQATLAKAGSGFAAGFAVAAAASAAASAAADAARRIAECDAALDILRPVIRRLGYALACLSRVTDDLEGIYEAPYALVRGGGKLPFEGEWLTGVTPATPHHAIAG
jgi:hypothetical protein